MKALVIPGLILFVAGMAKPVAAQRLTPGHGSAVVSISPATATLGAGQTVQFTASITGQIDQTVKWSISPAVGTISAAGLYTAPASVTSLMTVFATATDVADPTRSVTVEISLYPVVTVSVSPPAVTVTSSQSAQFTPVVNGTTNPAVTWSLSPAEGSISASGLYTAPSVINTQQTVVVTATSVTDPTQSSASVITLQPVVSVTLNPTSATISASQTQQFYAKVTGTTNPAVNWTLTPPLGSISASGLYTPPSSVTSVQQITVAAISAANINRYATATITINPLVPLTLNVSSVTLAASQSQQFLASTATGPAEVVWSLSPNVGSISSAGVYTAPPSIPTPMTVTVTATTLTSPTQSASAVVLLQNSTSTGSPGSVNLPIEVIGPDGYTVSVPLVVGSVPPGTQQLSLRVHGLHYDTEASVQVNGSGWLPISNATVTLQGLAVNYGGIGGGFSTFDMTINLPAGAISAGTNTVQFRFNGTNGRISGFRVLKVNFLINNSPLFSESAFAYDDPSTWTAPSTKPSDIAAGKTLWYAAALTAPTSTGPQAIQAHCTDCHAQDGRDLKYFNYSNNSIRVRSMFHGLTAAEGDQIASYIRSLNIVVPPNARPWNPPYQPGPGLDSQPVQNWSAGAGIDAVLQHDADMLPYLMPGGSAANWAPTASLSAREVPITLQLPDWNSWLPGVHPIDGYGNTFLTDVFFTNYQAIRISLVPNSPTDYAAAKSIIWLWQIYYVNFMNKVALPKTSPGFNTQQYLNTITSLSLWELVKLWEINQEFGLEGMPTAAFGLQAEPRAWYSPMPFFASPGVMTLPVSLIGNGLPTTQLYEAQVWYQLQLTLNAGNNRGTKIPTFATADFPYVYDHVGSFSWAVTPISPQGLLQTEWLIKALQGSEFGASPAAGSGGWEPSFNDAHRLSGYSLWDTTLSPSARATVLEAYLSQWYAKVSSYAPSDYYTGKWASATEIPDPTQADSQGDGTPGFGDAVAFMLPRFMYFGVSSTLTDKIIAWAKTVWPLYGWDATRSAVCTPGPVALDCTW